MKWIILSLLAFIPTLSSATPKLGEPLPPVVLHGEDEGLMVLGDDVTYARFDSAAVAANKVRLVVHMAGRRSSKTLGGVFLDVLKDAKLPSASFQAVFVANMGDALFGTSTIVRKLIESRHRKTPHYIYAVDQHETARKAWHLKQESFAVMLLNRQGQVLFATEGKLSGAISKAIIEMARTELAKP